MNDNFKSISEYLGSKTSYRARIQAIDALIDAILLKLADNVGNVDISEYQMDDGQMKVRTAYRTPEDATKGIEALEKIKQNYINQLNGRCTVFRGGNL